MNGAGPQHRSRKDDDPEPVDRDKIEAALNVISSDCSYEGLAERRRRASLRTRRSTASSCSTAGRQRPQAGYRRRHADDIRPTKAGSAGAAARTMHSITIATIFHYADQADPAWRQRYDDEERQRAFARMAAGAGASNGAGTSGAGAGTGSTGNSSSGAGTGAGTASPQPSLIPATPYVWIDPANIPQRDWLYGRLLIRKFVTATVAPGGLGKSSLITVEALSQVSGKDLLGVTPKEQLRVWLWNLEDPQEETQRKIQAAAKHYGLKPEDIGNRLFVDSGRDRPLVIATMTPERPHDRAAGGRCAGRGDHRQADRRPDHRPLRLVPRTPRERQHRTGHGREGMGQGRRTRQLCGPPGRPHPQDERLRKPR